MITFDVVQGTTEWAMLRVGIPTASNFDKIITPKTMKLSGQCDGYAAQLIAEQILKVPLDNATSGFMERGQVLEKKAVAYYELERDCESEAVGFIMRDDRRVGASPDRLVGADGIVEIKCPAAHTHVAYLLDKDGIGYRTQVQGQLWISERQWCDTLSFNPDMPPALVRQHRDDDFIKKLAECVDQFLDYMHESKLKLQQQYGMFPELKPRPLRVVA